MMQQQLAVAEEKVWDKVQDMPKLSKLMEADDIEAYLTTFERTMEAYEIDQGRWAFNLAPHLTGRAQQAHATLDSLQATQYAEVKKAILNGPLRAV